MQCNIKKHLQKAHDNRENVKRFDFKPRSVVDILTRSWGEVTHSSHVDAFQSRPCLENAPVFSSSHAHSQVGAAAEAAHAGGHAHGGCPLAMLTEAPETHHRTWRTKTNPQRSAEFPWGSAKDRSGGCFLFVYFLCAVSEYIMIQTFLACRHKAFFCGTIDIYFFMILQIPFFIFFQISADFSIFCGGVLSHSKHKSV